MLQNSTEKASKMLHVSWEAATIIGIASFINMIILAYLIRSKITKVYSDVETKITAAFTSGLADTLDDVGQKVVSSGIKAISSSCPQMKDDMMKELGALAGEGIETMFTKLKMSAMGALGGAAMHDKSLVTEFGSILKEDILPQIGELTGNPLLSFIMGNERIQAFLEAHPDALPLIERYVLPFLPKTMGGNSLQGGAPHDSSSYGV